MFGTKRGWDPVIDGKHGRNYHHDSVSSQESQKTADTILSSPKGQIVRSPTTYNFGRSPLDGSMPILGPIENASDSEKM